MTAVIALTVAAAADAQPEKSKTVMAIVVQTTGLQTAIAMMAPTNGMVLQFTSTATNSTAMAATASAMVVGVALQVKSKTATEIVALKLGLVTATATTVHTNGTVFQFT